MIWIAHRSRNSKNQISFNKQIVLGKIRIVTQKLALFFVLVITCWVQQATGDIGKACLQDGDTAIFRGTKVSLSAGRTVMTSLPLVFKEEMTIATTDWIKIY